MNQRSLAEQKKASQERTDISVLCPEGTKETRDRRAAVHSWAPTVIFQKKWKAGATGFKWVSCVTIYWSWSPAAEF